MLTYKAAYQFVDGGVHAHVLDFPGAITCGADLADARRLRIPVCDAANPDAGDFVFPAIVRRGGLTLAVSTGGASPTLSARIRDRLHADYGPEYGEWVAVLDEVRQRVLEVVPDAALRRQLLAGFAEDLWLDRLREAGAEVARREMLAAVAAAATKFD